MDAVRTPCVPRTPDCTRGIIFDLGDVLHDDTLWRRRLCQQCAAMGLPAVYPRFLDAWDRDFVPSLHRGRTDLRSALKEFLRRLGLRHSQVDEAVASALAARRLVDEQDRPFPAVRATLEQLSREGYALCVFANSSRRLDELEAQLTAWRLAGRFRTLLSSAELGAGFPDPAAYLSALSSLALPAGRVAVFAADAAGAAGAAAVRCRTIAYAHSRAPAADLIVETFAELPGRLEGLFAPPLRRSA